MSYQNCTLEGNLPGCIVKDDKPDEQCSQGRTGKQLVMTDFPISNFVLPNWDLLSHPLK